MCYKIEVQNKNAEKLNRKLDELNAPQFLRDYLNELESKNGALNYLVAIKDFLQWLIESNIINKKSISEIEVSDFSDLRPQNISSYLRYKETNGMSPTTTETRKNNYGMANEIQDAISEELGVQQIMIDSQLLSAQRRKRLYWTNIPNITLPDDKGLLVKDVICDDPDLVKYFDDRIRNTMIKCENYIKYDLGGKGHYSQQDRLYFLDKKAPTVPRCRTETKFNVWLGGEKYKKTCPLEIERLQTLPDNYTEFGMDESGNVKVMPKTRRFEAIGNGWTVDVIAHILSFMKL